MAEIYLQAEFVMSSAEVSKCPKTDLPEYAFIGRSNVGKSSLVNMLTGRTHLAKVSSTPGKTQLINHFLIDKAWYLVDLPGYGFAKVAKSEKGKWKKMIEQYLLERLNLMNVFVLVDSRHEPQKNDLEFMEWLGETSIPFSIIFTKADKLSSTKLDSSIALYKRMLKQSWEELPPHFVSSSESKLGRNEIIEYIRQINASIKA
jgi:GTP-binding protein